MGWEKLTTDKSVARIVSEAVVGKSATDALAGTTEDMKELKDKAGETVSAIGEAVGGADSQQRTSCSDVSAGWVKSPVCFWA